MKPITWAMALFTVFTGISLSCSTGGGPEMAVTEERRGEDPTRAVVVEEPVVPAEPQETPPATQEVPKTRSAATEEVRLVAVTETPQEEGDFAPNAFPPTIPDTEWHQKAWLQQDCLRCHETGVDDAPELVHADLPEVLLTAKCRSCHVFIPGSKPRKRPPPKDTGFAANAFPPMIPASGSHPRTWNKDDCLLCHETGSHGAPKMKHRDLPAVLLTAKCRSCHVQVRVVDSDPKTVR